MEWREGETKMEDFPIFVTERGGKERERYITRAGERERYITRGREGEIYNEREKGRDI